ncbi:MAG: invasin [Gordonia amarae]
MTRGELIADPAALEELAKALEEDAYSIESRPVPEVAAIIAAALPESPLAAATTDATQTIKQSLTAVSGQWETLASTIRMFRSTVEKEDEEAAARVRSLPDLPGESR